MSFRSVPHLIYALLAVYMAAGASSAHAQNTFPQYDHVFLIIMENEGFTQLIGNPHAPIMNALAQDYGLAENYRGVADPSEPNYVAMLGGDFFGINTDDPYWFPGNTVSANNLMSELETAGKTWKGYFQNMPYAGYRGYCYPDKCLGIPDSDTQYVAKHNGIVNFADLQTASELAKMSPVTQLTTDLSEGTVPNFSYIVPDECHDMHGAPPWCVDSDNTGTPEQSFLIAQGDAYVGTLVNQITASSMWETGNNAIVITFDEGNSATSEIATIVVTNHGPRGVTDKDALNHYSLLASLQATFGGLPCLVNSCGATLMTDLFTVTGTNTVPALPPPFTFPTTTDTISAQGAGKQAAAFSTSGLTGWNLVPSVSFGSLDNNLTSVSAASFSDAWAVGAYYPSSSNILATLAHHFDGTRWTAFPLPNVGTEENVLMGVSMPAPGSAWAVGYFVNGDFQQKTLVEHFNGSVWSVVSSPSPGALQNILYGVAAISDSDVWAVGADQDANGLWHTLTEHWNGSAWSVVNAVDEGSTGNQFYALQALASNNIYAVGQESNSDFPNEALIEHWNGKSWSVVSSPSDAQTALPLSVNATASTLTLVGQEESDTAPYTTYVAQGTPGALAIQMSPNNGTGENDLFSVTTAADGSSWAVGWDIDPSTDNHLPLIIQGVNGVWSLGSSPSFRSGSDSGFAGICAIPGGGMWAVGVSALPSGNYSTVIEFHP